jgi:hypothetical protein
VSRTFSRVNPCKKQARGGFFGKPDFIGESFAMPVTVVYFMHHVVYFLL